MPEESDDTGQAFILGLDGVPWQMLSDWADDGSLPNFARLFESGATGPLESTTMATTPVAWPSIFTGVDPDKHGMYAFHELTSAHTRQLNTNLDIGYPKLWDLLSPAVVMNVPMTYPAREMDGTLVSGMLSPSMDADFTHPPELADEIKERIPGYEIGLQWYDYHGEEAALVDDIDDMVRARRELLSMLMETTDDWGLFFTVFTAPDRLQHLCWDEDVLLDHYETLDAILGDVMSFVEDSDATLYVVSDHGFGPIDRSVYPNVILAEEGFLAPKEKRNVRGVLDRIGLTRDTVLDGLGRIGIDEQSIIEHLPESVVHLAGEQFPGDHALYDVEFSETQAFLNSHGAVYVNDTDRFDSGAVDPAAVDEVKSTVAETLESVRDPETNEQVFTVRDGDDLFPRDDTSPDLVLVPGNRYTIGTALNETPFDGPGVYDATHRSEGIFLAWGTDVDQGVRVADAHVIDVMPTVLHGAGSKLPAHLDGDVLDDVFTPESRPATTAVQSEDSERANMKNNDDLSHDSEGVEDRLRGLGYIE